MKIIMVSHCFKAVFAKKRAHCIVKSYRNDRKDESLKKISIWGIMKRYIIKLDSITSCSVWTLEAILFLL